MSGEDMSEDVTGAEQPAQSPSSPKRGRTRALVAGGAALAIVGGTAAWAAGTGRIGGSSQPEDVLPSDAVFFAKVDLDPGVAQKVGAFRLFEKLPDAKKALAANDPKKALFDLAKKADPSLDVDYARDIEPWLGDRAGVALLAPQGGKTDPVPVVALSVKDEAKAREGVARLAESGAKAASRAKAKVSHTPTAASSPSSSDTAVVFKDGYVLLGAKRDEARIQQASNAAPLADNDTFKGDMASLGETGVISGWTDNTRLNAWTGTTPEDRTMKEVASHMGRSTFALRFGVDHLEVAQVSRGLTKGVNSPPVQSIKDLPADTEAVASFTGGSDYVKQWWPTLKKLVADGDKSLEKDLTQFTKDTGIVLPDDLQTLLGSQFDLVVGKSTLSTNTADPKIGVRMWTDTAKAQAVIDKVRAAAKKSGEDLPITTKVNGNHLDVPLNPADTTTLAGGGSLGSVPGFATVLPGIDTSSGVFFLNLDAIEAQYLSFVPADERDLVKSLQAVGGSSGPVVDGGQRSTLRISVN